MKCNLCGSNHVNLVNNSLLYGKEYGKYPYVYLCTDCNAYVGVHPNLKPMGVLADNEMRELRRKCHDLFDKRWTTKEERENQYNILGRQLGYERGRCHFSWMSKDELLKALLVLEAST